MVGEPLSHDKVLEKVGADSRGEVYRTSETKLNREVTVRA